MSSRFYAVQHAGATHCRTTSRTYTHAVVGVVDGERMLREDAARREASEGAARTRDRLTHERYAREANLRPGTMHYNHSGRLTPATEFTVSWARERLAEHPTAEAYVAAQAAERASSAAHWAADYQRRHGTVQLLGFCGRPELAQALAEKGRTGGNHGWLYSEVVVLEARLVTDRAEQRALKRAEKAQR